MKRLHPAEILGFLAGGVILGVMVVMLGGLSFFTSPLCLVLALLLAVYAFLKPNLALAILALAAGMLVGAWRSSNYLLSAGAGVVEEGQSLLGVIKNDYASGIVEKIGGEEAELGVSYLLGMKEGLSRQTADNLKMVGLMHIVVASGTHLSILVGIMQKIFGKLSRAAGLIFALLFIILFASMIGWTASITRAAVVSILALTMGYVGRKFKPLRLIVLAMMITLLINPGNLLALGWQLSFAAYVGILLIAPALTKFFYGEKRPNMLAELLIASMSATLACLPIQLYFFGQLNILSLLANLIILPTIPYAMGLTFLAGLGGILASMGNVAGWAARILLGLHLKIVAFLAEQKVFLIEIAPAQQWVLGLYIIIVLPWLVRLLLKKFKRIAHGVRNSELGMPP